MIVRRSATARRRLFCTGHFAKSIIWSFCDLLMIYYLNVRLGLSGGALALVLVPALLLSGMLNVILGYALCRISPRGILMMQAVGAAATGVGIVTLFAINPGNSIALLLMMAGFRIAYTLYDVTQNALTSLLPADEADARRYVTLRLMLSSVARLAVASAAMLLVGNAAPLLGSEAVLLLPVAMLAIASSLALTRAPLPMDVATSAALPTMSAIPRDIAPLLAAAFFHAAALSTPARLIPFIADGQTLLLVFVTGTLVGPLAANALTVRLGNAHGVITLTLLTIVGQASLVMPASFFGEAAGIATYGVGVGGTGMLLWGDMSRIIRHHASRTGERADLPTFALLTGAIKVGISASTGVMAWLVGTGEVARPSGAIAAIAVAGGVAYVLAMRLGSSRAYPAWPAVTG